MVVSLGASQAVEFPMVPWIASIQYSPISSTHTHKHSNHHDIPLATRAILNQHIRVSVEESSGILGRCWFHPKPVVPSTWGRSFWTPTVLGRADCLAWQGSLASHVRRSTDAHLPVLNMLRCDQPEITGTSVLEVRGLFSAGFP